MTTTSLPFAGQVAAVTGAASGIGRASAEALLAGSARVVLIDRNESALAALCKQLGDAATPTPEQVAAKEQAWRRFLEDSAHSPLAHAADVLVGAYLLPKTPETVDAVPTN